jgi:MFS family permease
VEEAELCVASCRPFLSVLESLHPIFLSSRVRQRTQLRPKHGDLHYFHSQFWVSLWTIAVWLSRTHGWAIQPRSLVSDIVRLIFCYLRITSTASIIIFAVLYGFSSGFIIALAPTTLAALAEQPNEIGSYVGMAMGVIGLAALTGAPITGAMVSRFGGYDQAMIFSGTVIFIYNFPPTPCVEDFRHQ